MKLSLSDAHDLLAREHAFPVLHITSGDSLAYSLGDIGLPDEQNGLVSFREAMCDGNTAEMPFSESFQKIRATALGVSPDEYHRRVIEPLAPFLSAQYPSLALWFGEDMFCIANLVTLLAYLDMSAYTGQIFLFSVEECIPEMAAPPTLISARGFGWIYEMLLCRHRLPENLPDSFRTGAYLYLDYHNPDGILNGYIRSHLDMDALVSHLLSRFPEYGLGDTQYQKQIERLQSEKRSR